MKKYLVFILGFFFFFSAFPALAAQIIGEDTIVIGPEQKDLRDLYLFGGNIRVSAPVMNDLVTGGGDIRLNSDVTGSFFAGGGNITTQGNIGNTMRVAGGNILIEGDVAHDLAITGGSVTVTKDATIGGDVLFLGGDLVIDGSVNGKILLNGGQVMINGPIGGNIEGNIGKLTIGPNASIDGDLNYSSSQKAYIQNGATIRGQEHFSKIEDHQDPKESGKKFFAIAALYKLITDIILSVLFIIFFHKFIRRVSDLINASPFKSGAYGFAYILLFPIICLISLSLIWLGLAGFLVYALTILVSVFLAKVFLGHYALMWFYRWQKKTYILDWKAGIIGPILLFILLFIPVIGWIIVAFLLFIAIGGLMQELTRTASLQKINRTARIVSKKSK